MIHVLLSCESDRPSQFAPRCARYEATIPPEQATQWMADRLREHGWTSIDGKNYCPRHNPADIGAPVTLTSEAYLPLGDSGWEARARMPEDARFDVALASIEIRQRRGGDDD